MNIPDINLLDWIVELIAPITFAIKYLWGKIQPIFRSHHPKFTMGARIHNYGYIFYREQYELACLTSSVVLKHDTKTDKYTILTSTGVIERDREIIEKTYKLLSSRFSFWDSKRILTGDRRAQTRSFSFRKLVV